MTSVTPRPPSANCTASTSANGNNYIQYSQKAFSHPGHELILESHDESARNAFIYIGLILSVYLIAVIAIVVRYLLMRSNRDIRYNVYNASPRRLSKARRRHSGLSPLTVPSVVISPHVVHIEPTEHIAHIEPQKVLQETEL